MRHRHISHVVGFDDAPFARSHRGDVLVVGAVFADGRLDGVLSCRVRRDGANATRALTDLLRSCRFYAQLDLVMLQGIAFGGFNVVDIWGLAEQTGLPVLVVARKKPDLVAIERALVEHVRGGGVKWQLIAKAGAMESLGALFIQRAGIARDEAAAVLARFTRFGKLPEPLRAAHLIAGGIATGHSRGGA